MDIVSQHSNLDFRNCEWRKKQQINLLFTRELYELFYSNIPMENAMVSVAFYKGKVLLSASVPDVILFENTTIPADKKNIIWCYDSIQNKYCLMRWNLNQYQKEYYFVSSGKLFRKNDVRRFFLNDTWTNGKVFLPDPLTRANVLYGGAYRDRHDSTYNEVEAQMPTKKLFCRWKNDSFRLENQWLHFAEVSSPLNNHAVSKNSFNYFRNQEQFEEVNVFYHLTQLQFWWDSLGFSSYKDTAILDVHAYFGADESGINPDVSPPTIEFGDGGVDDAEDADSPCHEYTHIAFNSLLPGSYTGTQRQGVEEGICDLMAVLYSQKNSPNQKGWVYNWDGHNEFWGGRTLDNGRHYPNNLTNQPHVDGQLFGGALWDLSNELGADSTLKIVMSAMPFMVAGISMRKAATILLQTDSLLFNGRNNWPLVKALWPRGLLPNVGINNATAKNGFWVRNSENFSNGNGELQIFDVAGEKLELYEINGRKLFDLQLNPSGFASLNPCDFKAGVYVLKGKNKAEKIVKY